MKKAFIDYSINSVSLLMHEQENLSHIRHLLLVKPSVDNRVPKYFVGHRYATNKKFQQSFLSARRKLKSSSRTGFTNYYNVIFLIATL